MTDRCEKCYGTGWIVTERNGIEYATRCSCPLGELHTLKAENSNIPPRFIDSRFDNIKMVSDSVREAVGVAVRFAQDYPALDKGLLFAGSPGVGKTKIMCAIANEILGRDDIKPTVYYVDWNDLLRDLGSGETFDSRDFGLIKELTDKVKEADLIFFDELGACKASEWVMSKVYEIINTRYNRMKVTCFATNFADKSLQQTLGGRLVSRISEMTDRHVVLARDYRRGK